MDTTFPTLKCQSEYCAECQRVTWAVRTSGGIEEGDFIADIDVSGRSDDHLGDIQIDERIAAVIHEHLVHNRRVSIGHLSACQSQCTELR